jgi:hypothetical protein
MFDALLDKLETDLRAALNTAVTGLVATARTRLEVAVAELADERTRGLAEVADERAKGLDDVDRRQRELSREIEAMQRHKEAQEGRVELNIGGYRYETSAQALRRVPHTFFDAYFSGGMHRTCVLTAVSSWIATASTLVMSWNTCAMVWCRWRRLGLVGAYLCCAR